jgi:hypothetical protein
MFSPKKININNTGRKLIMPHLIPIPPIFMDFPSAVIHSKSDKP